MPGAIGGCFSTLRSNSTTIFIAGAAFHVFRIPVAGYSSFGSVIKIEDFGHSECRTDEHHLHSHRASSGRKRQRSND